MLRPHRGKQREPGVGKMVCRGLFSPVRARALPHSRLAAAQGGHGQDTARDQEGGCQPEEQAHAQAEREVERKCIRQN